MSALSDAGNLQAHRARLSAGEPLRRSVPYKMYGGYGENEKCDCCGRAIGINDAMFEIEFLREASPQIFAMHIQCFDAWMAESQVQTHFVPVAS